MSFFAPFLAFLLGPFGVAYATAVIMTADDPGMMAPPSGGGSFSGQPAPGGNFGSPSGGNFGGPGDMGGNFGGQQGGQFGGPGNMGGNFGGQGGQGGQFDSKQGQFGMPGQGGQGGGQQGGPGNMGPGGQGQFGEGEQGFGGENGQFGDQEGFGQGRNDEDMQKEQDERQKKQEEEQNKRCLTDMKRGMKGMERPIKDLEKKIAQVKRQKATVPAAVADTLATLKAGLQQMNAAQTCDDAQEIQGQLSDSMENMQDLFMQVEFALQAPKIVKQIKRDIGMLEKEWKRTKAAGLKSKVDLSEQLNEGERIYQELKAMGDQMIAAVASGNFEIMQEMMEQGTGGEEKREELMDVIQTIQAVKNTGQMLKGLNTHLSGIKRMVTNLKRQKKDVTELNACLDAGKVAIADVKTASTAKPLDFDIMIDAFEAANGVLDSCEDIAQQLSGQQDEGLFDDFFSGDMRKQIQSRPRPEQEGPEGGEFGGPGGEQGGQFGGQQSFGGNSSFGGGF